MTTASRTHRSTDSGPETADLESAATVTEVVLPGVVDPAGLQVRTRPLPTRSDGRARGALVNVAAWPGSTASG